MRTNATVSIPQSASLPERAELQSWWLGTFLWDWQFLPSPGHRISTSLSVDTTAVRDALVREFISSLSPTPTRMVDY